MVGFWLVWGGFGVSGGLRVDLWWIWGGIRLRLGWICGGYGVQLVWIYGRYTVELRGGLGVAVRVVSYVAFVSW